MGVINFDSLAYYESLKEAGVPEKQASAIAHGMWKHAVAIQEANDADSRKKLATKGDIAQLDGEINETEFRLLRELQEVKFRLLKEIEAIRGENR